MVVLSAIASSPEDIEWTDDNSARNNFHGTSVLLMKEKKKCKLKH